MSALSRAEAWVNSNPGYGTVSISTESIEIPYLRYVEPDLTWEFIDAAGHFHAYDNSGSAPTLEKFSRLVETCTFDCCDEEYEETAWRCRVCREEIEPGTKVRFNHTKTLPGRMEWEMEIMLPNPPAPPPGAHVSARVGPVFGVGIVTEIRWEFDSGATLRILGSGPLGRRP